MLLSLRGYQSSWLRGDLIAALTVWAVDIAGGIALVAFASLDEHGVAVVGRVPSGLPTPIAPSFDHVGSLLAVRSPSR